MEVSLNVYDIWDRNGWLYWMGLGVFHSGVVIRSTQPHHEEAIEVSYGHHPFDRSGVYTHHPGVPVPNAPNIAPLRVAFPLLFAFFCFRSVFLIGGEQTTVLMGVVRKTKREVEMELQAMALAWKGCEYHLLRRNCNHFTSALLERLLGTPAPGWVNRLAYLGGKLECVAPPERLLRLFGLSDAVDEQEGPRDLENSWEGSGVVLNPQERFTPPQTTEERRALLAEATKRRLSFEEDDNDKDI